MLLLALGVIAFCTLPLALPAVIMAEGLNRKAWGFFVEMMLTVYLPLLGAVVIGLVWIAGEHIFV